MNRALPQALSEDEIDRLAARLADFPGAMSLESVDGLFCALIAAPELTMPSDYLPVILDSASPESGAFRDEADAQETIGLLMRYWNSIARDFEHETFHVAYRSESGGDGVPGRAWARGYLRGTRLAPHGWDRIFEDEHEGLLLAVPLAAGEVDPAWPKEPLTTEQSSAMWVDMLAGAARAYRYFKADRLAQAGSAAAARTPGPAPFERESPKIGRNDPCPCGSGKKYKRCCGSPKSGNRVVH